MNLPYPFDAFFGADLFDTLLPDFVLGFAFFTSVIYAVLSRRFGQQRPAVVMSAALGLVLAAGLVWWEYVNGFSIRHLGPIAAGFAVIILGGVLYQAIRQVGGSWAGAGIALGASLLVGWTLGLALPVRSEVVQSIVTVTLIAGMIAFLLHRRGHGVRTPRGAYEPADVRHDMSNVYDDYRVADRLRRGFRHLHHEAGNLHEHPKHASDILLQLKRMLPAEGWLTERLAKLRERAYLACRGHITRITELREQITKLPTRARLKAGKELATRYKELQIDRRLKRLDRACAENERRVRELTRQAATYTQAHDQPKLLETLKAAEKLQHHNEKLFKLIDQTERRLLSLARQATRTSTEVIQP